MGLGLPFALLLALGVGLVVLAHALRRGRADPVVFPATRLIMENPASAKTRQRIEDRSLLTMRSLLIIALALLAASPFVSCSRLTLAREHGASIAAVLIIDDSASMQAKVAGKTRLELATQAALQLLSDAQAGDAFSVVLSGAPARVLVPSTEDIASVKDAVRAIETTDRDTDLGSALALSRGLLHADAAQPDQPIILLSDLSLTEPAELDLEGVTLPNIGASDALSNCALLKATPAQQALLVDVTCTGAEAIASRTLQLLDEAGKPWGSAVPAHDGIVSLALPKGAQDAKQLLHARVQLSSSDHDQIASDDTTFILSITPNVSFAVRADIAKAGVKTSSDTVLQAGIEALERAVRVQPLSLLPDDEAGLAEFAGLLIDDPNGLSPETRNAIEAWVKKGGVAVVFLGPAINRTPLGSNFQPFLTSAPSWSNETSEGASPDHAGALGPLTVTWSDIEARGRALIATESDLRPLASWTDGAPLVASRRLGQGLLIISSLPSSIDLSDFAIRPAYLELLEYIVVQASSRMGSSASVVGQRWRVAQGTKVSDQTGRQLQPLSLAVDLRDLSGEGNHLTGTSLVEPDRAGVYTLADANQTSTKYALRHAREHTAQPRTDLSPTAGQHRTASTSKVGISREMALLVLVLSSAELILRLFRREKFAHLGGSLQDVKTSTKVPAS